jgi:cyclophilin family peptidyl-prolyl cis-trans isomerase
VSAIAPASSQETAVPDSSNPSTNGDATSTPDVVGQAQAAFEKAFDAYKAAIRDIEQLQTEFQTADAAKREQLNAKFTAQVAHAQTLINQMVEAGVEAYRAAPNSNQQITDLLLAVARYYVVGRELPQSDGQIDGGDQYERALPIIKVLVGGGVDNQELLLWGFLSAFATNDFDLADGYYQQAQQAATTEEQELPSDAAKTEALSLIGKLAPMLDHYRQLWAKESEIRTAEDEANDLPRVKLTTTKGEITLELFENEAPQSVANFLTLVKQGYYNGSPFHRVLPKFMAQGGSKNDDGSGELGYAIRDESTRPDRRTHFRGSLSMARLPNPLRDSGGSQFFLTFVPTPHLDGEHTVFGRVIDGIEVLADIQRREPSEDPAANAALPKADRILKAEVVRGSKNELVFEKLPEP